jgi:hypothetical protein
LTINQITSKIIVRLLKWRYILIVLSIGLAILGYLYASRVSPMLTARSSFYPLTSTQDKGSATNKVTEFLGGGSGSKSLAEEANVNIEEVGRSKKTREAVAAKRLVEFDNKTIAELLIEENNKHKSFFEPLIEKPKTDSMAIRIGGELLKSLYEVKFNKNNLLEVKYSSHNENFLQPICNVLTNTISQFYIELKIEKAKVDFDFLQAKVDSFTQILEHFDEKRIRIEKTTLFVKPGQARFNIPVENLTADKLLVTQQRNNAIYNREEALLRLNKVTPIIKMLDKPTPPYDKQAPKKLVYAFGGFVLGLVLFSILLIIDLVIGFTNKSINEAIKKNMEEAKG